MAGNRVVLSLGSNRDRQRNMDRAAELLSAAFTSLIFSSPVETEAYGSLAGTAPFLNQTVIAYTPLSIEELIPLLKTIERKAGRSPEDKSHGRIPIDIDLLQWNDTLLKADDLQRDYVRHFLRDMN